MGVQQGGGSWAVSACALLLAAACAPQPPLTPTVEEAGGQGTASARISTSSPLIVEWPAAERGRLESQLLKGPVAVRYEGAELELVAECRKSGTYRFVPMVPKSEHLVFGSALDLDASFPLGAARLGARLASGKQLELTTRLIGRWELDAEEGEEEQRGECRRATHVVTAASVGAFRLYSSATLGAGAGAETGSGPGLRGAREQERSVINADGSPEKCAEGSSQGPPTGCGALIRLELSPFGATRRELLHELGTLEFTPIEKRAAGAPIDAPFSSPPFLLKLCHDVATSVFGAARRDVQTYCESAESSEKKEHSSFPNPSDIETLQRSLSKASTPKSELLLLDAKIRSEKKASPKILERLQILADEHEFGSESGYFARYLLAGSGDPEIEERNLRELLHHPRLSAESWPRMRLANHMLVRDRAHAVAIAQSARSMASMCTDERLPILEWLGSEGAGVLSSGELFDIQLDAVLTLSAQGQLPSVSPLGRRAIQTHDFQTWDASKTELGKDQWALGALYWAEGAECLFRGNQRCAAQKWQELLEKAPHSPYVVPAYQALLRVVGKAQPSRLASLSKFRPQVQPGSPQRKAIGEQPACGPLDETQLQRVLDEATELAVLEAHQLREHDADWEVDSLAALAPELSSCATIHPSNGKARLLTLRIDPKKKKNRVVVTAADQGFESKQLAACVRRRTAGNASLFSTPFSVTIRVAPQPKSSFDHGQGWARHVRERFSCTAGDDAACLRLGKAWLRGDEVPREPGQALAIFSAKCGEGNQEACIEEAVLRKTEPSQSRSRSLLLQACDRGFGKACRLLSEMKGPHVVDERAFRHELLTQGCRAPVGDPAACVEVWYQQSEGGFPPLPPDEAQGLLTTACMTLGHGAIDGVCTTPAELMAAYPHRADGDLGRMTCARGVWQGCEAAFVDSPEEERPSWAHEGCEAGSPDACAWLSDEDKRLDKKRVIALIRRTLKLCATFEDTGHESVCDDLEPLRSRLRVLEWKRGASPVK